MNRKEFGQLFATLRQDLDWTQFQLSEYADIDEPVISQIERGVKKFFEPELLFQLANALQLTTLERREFSRLPADWSKSKSSASPRRRWRLMCSMSERALIK